VCLINSEFHSPAWAKIAGAVFSSVRNNEEQRTK
jgi:hypothetical protein